MSGTVSHRLRWTTHPLLWAIFWLVSYVVARVAIEADTLGLGIRLGLALVPVPIGATVLALLVRGARELDELERRIQLEALATAFLLAMIVLMTLGLLQRVVTLKFEDWSYMHVWAMLPMFYFVGLAFARRRYS